MQTAHPGIVVYRTPDPLKAPVAAFAVGERKRTELQWYCLFYIYRIQNGFTFHIIHSLLHH